MSLNVTENEITKPEYSEFEDMVNLVRSDLIKAGWRWEESDTNGDRVDLSTIVKNLLGVNKVCTSCKYYYHKEFIQYNNMGICIEDDTSHMFSSNGIFNGNEFGCIRHINM